MKDEALNVVISPSTYSQEEIRTACVGHLERAKLKDVPLTFEIAPKVQLPAGDPFKLGRIPARTLGMSSVDGMDE